MGTPYVGDIRMFGGNFAPSGWDFCEGQLLPIAEYDALFSLLGTTYGGDGQTTFALPDLRGRVPIHVGNGYVLGQQGGVENVTVTAAQIPNHTHPVAATTAAGTAASPSGDFLAAGVPMYVADTPNHALNAVSVKSAGGSQPHANHQPFLCVAFIISLFGIYPSRS